MAFWNSLESISGLSTIAQIAGAFVGVIIVILGWRVSTLQDRAKQESDTLIAQAGASAAEANKIAALANEGQAKAKLELAQLQAKLAPRDISEDQKKSFLKTLVGSKIAL